jgi:hypothetical protein
MPTISDEKRKENIKKIKDVFDMLDVYYENVSDYEIRVICPSDCLPFEKYYKLYNNNDKGQIELLEDKELAIIADDGMIYIEASEYGGLSWVMYSPWEDEK